MAAQQTQYAELTSYPIFCLRSDGRRMRVLTLFVVCFVFYSGSVSSALFELPDQCAISGDAKSLPPLAIQYQTLVKQLQQSVFGEPMILTSDAGDHYAQGEVYVVLKTPFYKLDRMLSQPAQWCELAILHQNIKTCTYGKNEAGKDQLQLYVGRKHYQEPSSAFPAQYLFSVNEKDPHTLNVNLSAPKGPLGTHDYQINLEAIAIDDHLSFVHFTYRYQYGFWADVAMRTYLTTMGRNKVGFTVKGKDENGEPIYIKGLKGVVERNVMRYIFAIQSVLEASETPDESRQLEQLNRWYGFISKYPKQLVGLTREEYLDNKKHELKNQQEAQIHGVQEEE